MFSYILWNNEQNSCVYNIYSYQIKVEKHDFYGAKRKKRRKQNVSVKLNMNLKFNIYWNHFHLNFLVFLILNHLPLNSLSHFVGQQNNSNSNWNAYLFKPKKTNFLLFFPLFSDIFSFWLITKRVFCSLYFGFHFILKIKV